jgi:hypothetical protein
MYLKQTNFEKLVEDMTVVHKISTEKKICIPHLVKLHLLKLIAQQSDQWMTSLYSMIWNKGISKSKRLFTKVVIVLLPIPLLFKHNL